MKKVVVIGSGFAGLSAAAFMAKAGWQVTVIEKHDQPGGRARLLKENGFSFDMGPSWYWMPDVFENFFAAFGRTVGDYYPLKRLDPSYRIYWNDGFTDIPAGYKALQQLFESIEPGSAAALDKFMEEAAYKYETGMHSLVYKPGASSTEFLDWKVIKGVFRLDVFTSIKKHIRKYFKNPKLQQLLEFPVLFLGALPENTPALYSLMNYADIKLGTWYPQGGMYAIVESMYGLAKELGVTFHFDTEATAIQVHNGVAKTVAANAGEKRIPVSFEADVVIGGADYHFVEQQLLSKENRVYSDEYWNKRVMAPACLLYYIGINRKLDNIQHHSLFFDVDFETHAAEIYSRPQWPSEPLFYVSAVSVTDPGAAPEGCENLFFLVPVAAGLENDTEELRNAYFDTIMRRFEERTGEKIKDNIIYKKSYGVRDFVNDYNAFKGNAYGLANTLMQTAILKPSCRSKKVKNLFYTGQLTIPGPGVPPALISGEVVAKQVIKYYGKKE